MRFCAGLPFLLILALPGCARNGPADRSNLQASAELRRTWQAVRLEAATVDSLASAGRLSDARHHARTLRDTAGLLPGLSGPYVSTRQGPLTAALRSIGTQADTLAAAADRGDSVLAWQAAKQMRHSVDYIGGLFPGRLLPGAAQAVGGAYARPVIKPDAAETVRLTCPMHLQITRLAPADSVGLITCPYCGMALVAMRSQTMTPLPPGVGASRGNDPPPAPNDPRPAPLGRHMDHRPRHGGQFAMQGDYHLELVTRPDGLISLYVYDAWTKPLSVAHASGEVTLEISEGTSGATELVVPLRVKPDVAGALSARVAGLERASAATVRLVLPDTSFSLTFPLSGGGGH